MRKLIAILAIIALAAGASFEAARADGGDADALELIAKYRAEYHVDLSANDKLTVPTDPKTAGVEYEFKEDKTIALSLPAEDEHADKAIKSNGGVAFYDGDAYDMAVVASEMGFSSYIIIHNETAPTSYEFDLTLPTGYKLSENGIGGVNILNANDEIEGIIAVPWAFDDNGDSVTTQFKLNGDTLVQSVEHANAVYPVIADPDLSFLRDLERLNRVEILWCALGPWNVHMCYRAYAVHARSAYAATGDRFGDPNTRNDDGDAFRHCYWSARMTIDLGLIRAAGALIAEGFGDRHEAFTEEADEKRMDLTNNAHGRRVGKIVAGRNKNAKYRNAEAKCYLWSQNGTLQTRP